MSNNSAMPLFVSTNSTTYKPPLEDTTNHNVRSISPVSTFILPFDLHLYSRRSRRNSVRTFVYRYQRAQRPQTSDSVEPARPTLTGVQLRQQQRKAQRLVRVQVLQCIACELSRVMQMYMRLFLFLVDAWLIAHCPHRKEFVRIAVA